MYKTFKQNFRKVKLFQKQKLLKHKTAAKQNPSGSARSGLSLKLIVLWGSYFKLSHFTGNL